MKITIREFKESDCWLFEPSGKCIGLISSFASFNDVRIQIKKSKLNGFYVKFGPQIINIDSDGKCDTFPEGFYDTIEKQLFELL